jgi:hypothetical protein
MKGTKPSKIRTGRRRASVCLEFPSTMIALSIDFDVSPGMMLVQGTAPQEVTHRRSIRHTLPPAFGDGVPLEIAGSRK